MTKICYQSTGWGSNNNNYNSMYFFLPFHWPRAHHMTANNCLQISVLLQIIFCSCVIEATLLSENGRSFSQAGREWFDIFSWSQERWSNDKTIEQGWAKYVVSVSQNNYLPHHSASANNRSAHHKSLYFAQPCPEDIFQGQNLLGALAKIPTILEIWLLLLCTVAYRNLESHH